MGPDILETFNHEQVSIGETEPLCVEEVPLHGGLGLWGGFTGLGDGGHTSSWEEAADPCWDLISIHLFREDVPHISGEVEGPDVADRMGGYGEV